MELSVALSHEHGSFVLNDVASTQRQHRCQEPVAGVNAWDLGEESLRTTNHAAGRDVVAGTVPRTYQASPAVGRSIGQVGAQVSTPAGHCEQFTVRVPYRVPTGSTDYARDELGCGP